MENRVVLITGGSSGIGKAVGTYLVSKGFRVYGTTRNPERYPGFSGFELVPMEVRDSETIKAAIAMILQKEGRLDILINNAGVGIGGPVEETPLDEVRKVLEVNLLGPVAVIRHVLPVMREQQSGLIINISSIAAYMGLPFRGYYSASKGALALLTESLRMETAGSGVIITSVAPGDVATNIASGRYHAPVLEDSPYKNAYEHSLGLMNQHVNKGQDPLLIARKIYRITRSKSPGVHYIVGSPIQRLSLVLKKILPDKLYEKLLLNHYKL